MYKNLRDCCLITASVNLKQRKNWLKKITFILSQTLPVYIISNTVIEILNNNATRNDINNTGLKGYYLRGKATSISK